MKTSIKEFFRGGLLSSLIKLVVFIAVTALASLVLGANLTTQVIKRVLVARESLAPGIEITPNSFPSGHTTLAATAMIALVLAGGRARVVLAPLGAAWTTAAGLGTLNHTALTVQAIERAGVRCAGIVIGSWPADPGLAELCNLEELGEAAGAPLLGRVPAGAGALSRAEFTAAAPGWIRDPQAQGPRA